jgi:hypothetical protein
MSQEAKDKIIAILEAAGVTYSAVYRGEKKNAFGTKGHAADEWSCAFTKGDGRELHEEFEFFTGLGHRVPNPSRLARESAASIANVSKRMLAWEFHYKLYPDVRVPPHAADLLYSLVSKGYKRESGWRGHTIRRIDIPRSNDIVMPYIDGNEQRICTLDDPKLLLIGGNGNELLGEADSQGGTMTGTVTYPYQCEDCGDGLGDDDTYTVGYHGDTTVCERCLCSNYTRVYGRNRDEYHVANDDAVEASNGESYDGQYLDDNDIVRCTVTHEYVPRDDAFECVWLEAYVHKDVEHVTVSSSGEIVTLKHLTKFLEDNPSYRAFVDGEQE